MSNPVEGDRIVVMQLAVTNGDLPVQGLRLFSDRRWHSPEGGFLSGHGSWIEPSHIANTIYLRDGSGRVLVTLSGGNFLNFTVGQSGRFVEAINANTGAWRVTALT